MKTNIKLWMYTPNGTGWYPFCLAWSNISCFKPENVSYKLPFCISGKITTVPRLFSDHLLQNENIKLWMYTPNGTCWYPFCLAWSSISYKLPFGISSKITTIPRLFSDHLLQNENIRLQLYTPNGTGWYPFCLAWSSISCFRPENISYI